MPTRHSDRVFWETRYRAMIYEPIRLVVLLLCSMLLIQPSSADEAQTTKPAPDFVLASSTGHNLRLSEYRGQVVVLNFWSVSCGPCLDQLAWIDDLEASDNSDLSVLSVNVDGHRHESHVVDDYDYRFPVLFDHDKDVIRRYDPQRLPMIVLVDPHGTIRFIHEGHRAGDETLFQRELTALLAE